MKIAVPSTEPSLEGYLANKLGTAPYLLIIETLDMSFEVMDAPTRSSGSGASVRAVSMVMDKGAQVILVGHISPFIINGFADQGIKIVSQVSGRVDKAVKQYMETQDRPHPDSLPETPSSQDQWMSALGMGLRQFKSFLPLVTGVVLIPGLFQGFIPEQRLISLFSGTIFKDSFQGACMGSLLAGNPVNSYVIGKSLLNLGVGIAGITALMLAWVNVGLIQMPAEAKALGTGFTLVRNIAEFIMAVLLSVVIAVFPGGGNMSQKPGLTIQKAVTMIKPWLFPLGVACLYAAGFLLAPENTEKALGKSGTIFRQLGFPLCLCLVMMVVLNRFLSPKTITRLLGKGSGIKGLVISSLAGILSMSPVYAWYPMLKTMKDKGAANFHLANFIGSRSVKPVLLPVLVGYLGWRFAGLFVLACLAGSFMTAGLVSLVCSESSSG